MTRKDTISIICILQKMKIAWLITNNRINLFDMKMLDFVWREQKYNARKED